LALDGSELSTEDVAYVASVRRSGGRLASAGAAEPLSDGYLASLRLALPAMLDAALPHSAGGLELRAAVVAAQKEGATWIDPHDNWYTRNVARFGGGFDMKALTAQPGLLATKFDRLAGKYDEWTAGNGCTYYGWIARAARVAPEGLRGAGASVLDVACGIGLPGHMLRLCGFAGRLSATDISAGMLEKARERRVYDELFVANANEGLDAVHDSSVDLVVCVGAMELLHHATVLLEFARVLRPGGKLWASFQWEGAVDAAGEPIPCPTEHQNVTGVTLQQLHAELEAAGFDATNATIEKSECAFYTPSPKQDGSVLPVPYIFVTVGLAYGFA